MRPGYPRRMDDKTAIVAGLSLFAGLDERSTQAVAALARIVSAPAGTVLMREGDVADTFFAIVRGTVHVERDGRFVRSMTDGGFLGEIALVEGGLRTASATCETDCQLLSFGGHEFGRLMDTFPEVRTRIEAAAARRPHAGASG